MSYEDRVSEVDKDVGKEADNEIAELKNQLQVERDAITFITSRDNNIKADAIEEAVEALRFDFEDPRISPPFTKERMLEYAKKLRELDET